MFLLAALSFRGCHNKQTCLKDLAVVLRLTPFPQCNLGVRIQFLFTVCLSIFLCFSGELEECRSHSGGTCCCWLPPGYCVYAEFLCSDTFISIKDSRLEMQLRPLFVPTCLLTFFSLTCYLLHTCFVEPPASSKPETRIAISTTLCKIPFCLIWLSLKICSPLSTDRFCSSSPPL